MIVNQSALVGKCDNLIHESVVGVSAIDVTQFHPFYSACAPIVPPIQLVSYFMLKSLAHC